MSFQKLIQATFLNKNKKEKKIKLNNGTTVSVKSGDILHIEVQDEGGFFKARFVDIEENGQVWAYLLNVDDDFVDIKVEQTRVQKIESPN